MMVAWTNLRRQVKTLFFWYPKEKAYLKIIHDEKIVQTDNELAMAMDF